MPSRSPRSARARRSVSSRSPRLAPSPMNARTSRGYPSRVLMVGVANLLPAPKTPGPMAWFSACAAFCVSEAPMLAMVTPEDPTVQRACERSSRNNTAEPYSKLPNVASTTPEPGNEALNDACSWVTTAAWPRTMLAKPKPPLLDTNAEVSGVVNPELIGNPSANDFEVFTTATCVFGSPVAVDEPLTVTGPTGQVSTPPCDSALAVWAVSVIVMEPPTTVPASAGAGRAMAARRPTDAARRRGMRMLDIVRMYAAAFDCRS